MHNQKPTSPVLRACMMSDQAIWISPKTGAQKHGFARVCHHQLALSTNSTARRFCWYIQHPGPLWSNHFKAWSLRSSCVLALPRVSLYSRHIYSCVCSDCSHFLIFHSCFFLHFHHLLTPHIHHAGAHPVLSYTHILFWFIPNFFF